MNLDSGLYRHSTVFFAVLVMFALIAFWPNYLSDPLSKNGYFHFHVFVMGLWCALLVTQPFMIRVGNRTLHRRLGRLSFVIAPLVPLSIVMLNHHRLQGVDLNPFTIWLFTSGWGELLLFSLAYILAIKERKSSPLHARYMVCTGIVFIPAIFDRVFLHHVLSSATLEVLPTLGGIPFTTLLSYLMVAFIMVGLAAWDRRSRIGAFVFPKMAGVFAVIYVVPFLLIDSPTWKTIIAAYTSLPLS